MRLKWLFWGTLITIAAAIALWAGGFWGDEPKGPSRQEIEDFFLAIETHDLKYVKQKLLMGFNPNTAKENGLTPLCFAAEMGHKDVVITLLEAGADEDQKSAGRSAIMCAGSKAKHDVVQLLSKVSREKPEKLKCRYPFCKRELNLGK